MICLWLHCKSKQGNAGGFPRSKPQKLQAMLLLEIVSADLSYL